MAITFSSVKGVRVQGASNSGPSLTIEKASSNLLAHIPGEASGFYLLSAQSFDQPSIGNLGVLCVLSSVLLLAVRWCANASIAVIATSLIAFALWMFVLEQGFFRALIPDLLPDPLGLIVASFFSAIVTVLATAGKLK